MQIVSPQAMMLVFETRCRQFQLGVQGYCLIQEDQRPLLHLKMKRKQVSLEKVFATKPSCQMQFALSTIKKHIKTKPCEQILKGLRKAESGKEQLKSMKQFLARLKNLMDSWKKSLCQKCKPIFHRRNGIKFCYQQIKKLIESQGEPKLLAKSFNQTIQILKCVIKSFKLQNQCITIPDRTKTQQGTHSKEKPDDDEEEEKPQQPRGQYTNQTSKIDE